MSRARYEESELWKVSDLEYEQTGNDNYVHPIARKVAEKIVAEWKKPDGHRVIVLKAPMQSGKTSVIRHICYLLNVVDASVHREKLLINTDSVFIMNHLVDTELKLQTIRRMHGVMEFPDLNVFHSRDSKLKQTSFVKALKSNRVILCDESHFGANEGGLIANCLDKWNSPLEYDAERMNKFNTYLLLVSATPFAEISSNVEKKRIFTMPYGSEYYGIWDMIKAENFIDHRTIPCLAHGASAEAIKSGFEKLFRFKSGFVFVRENVKSDASKDWVIRFKSMLDNSDDVIYFSLNATTNTVAPRGASYEKPVGIMKAYINAGCSMGVAKKIAKTASLRSPQAVGIDAVLCVEPEQIVVIFIKEMLLAGTLLLYLSMHLLHSWSLFVTGKTLDTSFVRMVIDLPLVNDDVTNCNRYAQGLMGRCCGYGKREHSVKVISSLKHAKNYSNWYTHNVAPSRPSHKTTGTSGKVVAKDTSAYEKSDLVGKPSEEDDEEPVDSVVHTLQELRLSQPAAAKAPRHKVKTVAVKKQVSDIEIDLGDAEVPVTAHDGHDEDYASDSGDEFIQSDDDEFYDSLVVDWTIRSADIKARLMARLKPASDATMAVATQMMKDVFEESDD